MRQIVLDTETTGIDPAQGHRIIEIGAIEILNRRLTGKVFQRYLQPDRLIDEGAIAVHGIHNEDLANEPRFPEIADEFIEFVRGAELIIHNAPFDVGFLDHELKLMQHAKPELRSFCSVLDTLPMARKMHPGQRNSLDALCRRYEVDNSKRDLHGALLDARLLAEVYLAMTGGQASLVLDASAMEGSAPGSTGTSKKIDRRGLELAVIRATDSELELHEQILDKIDSQSAEQAMWRRKA